MGSRWLVAVLGVWLAVAADGSAGAEGQLYKCKGSKGETVYSDQPCPGGEPLPMKETPTFQALPPPTLPAPVSKSAPKAPTINYQLAITKPAPDEVLRDNEGNVAVAGTVSPQLGDDHKVRLLLDGQPTGQPGNQTSWDLTNLDRGEHTVAIEVFNTKTGKSVQASPSVKFMLFRTSGNNRNPGLGTNGEQMQPYWPSMTAAAQPGDPTPPKTVTRPPGGPRR